MEPKEERMKKLFVFILIINIAVLSFASSKKMEPVSEKDGYGDKLGTVQLSMEYDTPAEPHIRRGLALLHHMTYNGARKEFVKAIEVDPESAMGYWGQSMTYIHPIWSDPPSEEDFNTGFALLEEAKKYAKGREIDYIEAVEAYYISGRGKNEKKNLKALAMGWKKVYEKYPEDMEAASFYALTYLSTANPDDKSYEVQRKAGKIAEDVLTVAPDHPGAHHYIIHAYDYPTLAPKALEVSNNYGKIAPDVPHALHMPTHIFTRLGLWEESIVMNRRSARAALAHPSNGQISLHYPHAVDYLVYAYIQKGQDMKAEEALKDLMDKREEFQTNIVSYYAFNAAPARILLERQEWEEAVTFKPWLPVNYEKGKFPAMEALTYFARALGSAKTGDTDTANEAIEEMKKLEEEAAKTSPYWAKQIRVQYLASTAWAMYNTDKEKGLKIMKEAAELEATTEKHPMTPGEVLPARELYGDMLMEMAYYEKAQKEYEKALERSRNRFNSLYGAGRAAELEGDISVALKYYEKLYTQAEESDTELGQLAYVREFIRRNK